MAGNGFRPIGVVGTGYAGELMAFSVLKNYGTSIFNGDPVAQYSDGTINRIDNVAEGDLGDTLGVFMGCQYVASSGQPTWNQYYPASQNVEGIVAYVAGTDPMTKYKVKILDGSGADTTLEIDEAIGQSFDIDTTASATAGSTFTGNSTMGLDSTTAGATAPWRVIALQNATEGPTSYTAATEFTHAIVIVNPLLHAYTNTAGI
jgi:hypothetical protein